MKFDEYWIEVTVRKNCKRMILRCRDGKLYLSVPPRTPKKTVTDFLSSHREWIKGALARHPAVTHTGDPAQLKALVARLLPVWEQRIGVKAAEVRWREMVSRWGSCQVKTARITLNLRLADKSAACIEYVLVHELCHLLHPDHSPAFYAKLAIFMPDWKERRLVLNGKAGGSIP